MGSPALLVSSFKSTFFFLFWAFLIFFETYAGLYTFPLLMHVGFVDVRALLGTVLLVI